MATPVTLVPDTPGGTLPTQPVSAASGAIASGAVASGAIASGAIAAGAQVDLLTMRGTKAAGTAAANSILAGVVFNATAPAPTDGQQVAAQADARGSHQINTEGKKITYSGGSSVTLAASATDVITLFGSATKTVRVTRIAISGAATTQSSFLTFLQRRTTADTVGTFVAQTAVTHDSGNAATTTTGFGHYTANPTVGTNAGSFRSWLQPFAVAASGQANRIEIDFTTRNSQGFVLRGIAEGLALNLGGQTVTGGVLYYDIEWTEE